MTLFGCECGHSKAVVDFGTVRTLVAYLDVHSIYGSSGVLLDIPCVSTPVANPPQQKTIKAAAAVLAKVAAEQATIGSKNTIADTEPLLVVCNKQPENSCKFGTSKGKPVLSCQSEEEPVSSFQLGDKAPVPCVPAPKHLIIKNQATANKTAGFQELLNNKQCAKITASC